MIFRVVLLSDQFFVIRGEEKIYIPSEMVMCCYIIRLLFFRIQWSNSCGKTKFKSKGINYFRVHIMMEHRICNSVRCYWKCPISTGCIFDKLLNDYLYTQANSCGNTKFESKGINYFRVMYILKTIGQFNIKQ